MHVAHSNLRVVEPTTKPKKKTAKEERGEAYEQFKREMAYKGWQKACKMFAAEIKEIQEYKPGWMPKLVMK